MRVVLTAALAALLAASAGGGHAAAQARPAAQADAGARVDRLSEDAQDAIEGRNPAKLAAALAALEAFIAEPGFAGLGENERRTAYVQAGRLAYIADRDALAHRYFKQATGFESAGPQLWALRFYGARAVGDKDDALLTLRTVVRRWPTYLKEMSQDAILDVVDEVGDRPDGAELEVALLQELFDSAWEPKPQIWSAIDRHWRDLTLALIERGQVQKADRVARRILDGYVLTEMHVDRRYDPVIQADPAGFDIAKAAEADVERSRRAVKDDPVDLKARAGLALRLQSLNRLDEALAVIDETIALARPAGGKTSALEGLDEINWAYDVRSRILRAAGRDGAALEALEQGAVASEQGAPNVSQTLNLGYDQMRMGRPREALATVDKVTANVSVYGRSVAAEVRVCAHHQLGDPAAAAAPLAFLRENRKAARGTLPFALLCANDLDGAAAVFVEELAEPERRRDVLMEVQDFAYLSSTSAFSRAIEERRRKVAARPEVKAAITRVGRVIRVPLMNE